MIADPLPFADGSLDFVFSNVLIQHFDDRELDRFLKESGRVLKTGAILLLIFKRKTNWTDFREKTGLKVNVIDPDGGLVEIEEPMIIEALRTAGPETTEFLTLGERLGMRLFRFFSTEEIAVPASKQKLRILDKVPYGNPDWPGIIKFDSGRGMPTEANFYTKTA